MQEVQDDVERAVSQRIAALPGGTWETVDYIDRDAAADDGMIPISAPPNFEVTAQWPTAETGFPMPFEKIMNAIFEMSSKIMSERAIARAFNLEYLLCGGRDLRKAETRIFMFYERLPGGCGGRNGKEGSDVSTACFGVGLKSQPKEGDERVNPTRTRRFDIQRVTAEPGKWRCGTGCSKPRRRSRTRARSYPASAPVSAVVWGVEGGLHSMPAG